MGKKDMVVAHGVVDYYPDDDEAGERLPVTDPEGGWPADEFSGQGGNYVRDPLTGVRSRVVPEADVAPVGE